MERKSNVIGNGLTEVVEGVSGRARRVLPIEGYQNSAVAPHGAVVAWLINLWDRSVSPGCYLLLAINPHETRAEELRLSTPLQSPSVTHVILLMTMPGFNPVRYTTEQIYKFASEMVLCVQQEAATDEQVIGLVSDLAAQIADGVLHPQPKHADEGEQEVWSEMIDFYVTKRMGEAVEMEIFVGM